MSASILQFIPLSCSLFCNPDTLKRREKLMNRFLHSLSFHPFCCRIKFLIILSLFYRSVELIGISKRHFEITLTYYSRDDLEKFCNDGFVD